MAISNDARGWILTAISGIACLVGATFICVDVLVRRFPHMQNFKIAESDAFLSASLSLSAGVILFSSLNSMLPASKQYLTSGGYSPRQASFIMIGVFLAGVFGIRIISQIMHKFIPSHVVDCDHTHDEEAAKHQHEEMTEHDHDGTHGHPYDHAKTSGHGDDDIGETAPLLPTATNPQTLQSTSTAPAGSIGKTSHTDDFTTTPGNKKASSIFPRSLSRTFSKYVSSGKNECDEDGPCMGYSDPCGQDCFKIVQRRGTNSSTHSQPRLSTWQRLPSDLRYDSPVIEEEHDHTEAHVRSHSPQLQRSHHSVSGPHFLGTGPRSRSTTHHYHHPEHEHPHNKMSRRRSSAHQSSQGQPSAGAADHHHHVPTNAFMSIGLQTSIAIALHKAPEGFITFATNHANPDLGFTVFVALFIHNITEGFALSLPLFLALNSRAKAIFWASILGGLSQPFGAGIAALWFKISSSSGHLAPNKKIYGGIFAVTAGIMASVGLSLLSESLQLSHNRNTCIQFAFVGMAILGLSMALAAK